MVISTHTKIPRVEGEEPAGRQLPPDPLELLQRARYLFSPIGHEKVKVFIRSFKDKGSIDYRTMLASVKERMVRTHLTPEAVRLVNLSSP